MKKTGLATLLLILLCCLISPESRSQTAQPLVFDRESIFTAEEAGRIDSLLQDYFHRSNKIVAVITDTADVSDKAFHSRSIQEIARNAPPKTAVILVLLSRRRSMVNLASSELGTGSPERFREFSEILAAGIPALKEKRREEGVTLMCMKAMQFLEKEK